MRRQWARFLDWLLGVQCVCGVRVFRRDWDRHEAVDHAGDRLSPWLGHER